MKKISITISDIDYEKLRLEAALEKKSVQQSLKERIFHKGFSRDTQDAYDEWLNKNLLLLMKD